MSVRKLIRRAGVQVVLLTAVATALITGAGSAQAATPHLFVSCGVAPPLVTDTFASGELSWSAGVQCNTVVGLQGTTVLFQWGSSQAFQFGSQYNGNFSAASSSGNRFGIFSGLWGVNNNVLITLPAGDTTTPSGGCVWFDTAHTQVKCTVTTGPIQAQ